MGGEPSQAYAEAAFTSTETGTHGSAISEHDHRDRARYQAWDAALGAKDVEAALALYAPDATIESPLVRHLLGVDRGVCRGHDELRRFIELVFRSQPPERGRFRTGFFTDGERLIWEYPRAAPDGDQMDFVESMDIQDGLIRRHRVYWGWFGVRMLETGQHGR